MAIAIAAAAASVALIIINQHHILTITAMLDCTAPIRPTTRPRNILASR
jgi:hypothetical protein